VEKWREQGEKVVVATVIATRRSAPRPVGASLAVSESGKRSGSVSGGCVESDVYENAREVLENGKPMLLSYGIADEEAWSVGLPCGGEIAVCVAKSPADFPRERFETERAVLFNVIDGEAAGTWLLAFES